MWSAIYDCHSEAYPLSQRCEKARIRVWDIETAVFRAGISTPLQTIALILLNLEVHSNSSPTRLDAAVALANVPSVPPGAGFAFHARTPLSRSHTRLTFVNLDLWEAFLPALSYCLRWITSANTKGLKAAPVNRPTRRKREKEKWVRLAASLQCFTHDSTTTSLPFGLSDPLPNIPSRRKPHDSALQITRHAKQHSSVASTATITNHSIRFIRFSFKTDCTTSVPPLQSKTILTRAVNLKLSPLP